MSISILRTHPRPGSQEHPVRTRRGYELVVGRKNKVEDATFVKTLEEAADLIEHHGYAIRIGCRGKRPSLISPSGLLVYASSGLDSFHFQLFQKQMYSEPSDRQIPPLRISDLQRWWGRGFSNVRQCARYRNDPCRTCHKQTSKGCRHKFSQLANAPRTPASQWYTPADVASNLKNHRRRRLIDLLCLPDCRVF